jgi:hypothetical protein
LLGLLVLLSDMEWPCWIQVSVRRPDGMAVRDKSVR